MALEFKLPDIGEGIAEGEIVKWLVNEGDTVAEHQPVVEVMTDKATVEIPAPQAGRVTALKAKAGDVVPVGQVIFVLDGVGNGKAAADARGAPAQPAKPASAPQFAPSAKKEERSAPPPPQPQAKPAQEKHGEPPAPLPPAPLPKGGGGTLGFKLPDIGEGIAEGEIVKWLVKEGDTVAEHQPVVEVMTDKATVEIPAPAAGRITALKVKAGEVVPIGTVLFELARDGAGAPAAAPAEPARGQASASPAAAPARSAPAAPREPAERPTNGDGRVRAVPSARRVARELGVDLGQVSGSGRGGIVRRADVEAFASSATSAPEAAEAPAGTPQAAPAKARPSFPPVSVPAGERETRTPFRGVRRKIAEAMSRSVHTAAHFSVVEELDVTELVRLREQAKRVGEEHGVKITYMPFIMKATALALARHPELNGTLDEEKQELVHFAYVNLGIATDTKNGLIVPVIRDVQAKGILQLAAELGDLAERTRAGKVRPDELQGGTFTITNAGNIGGIHATPIINFPEIAILGVHRIMKKPGVVETPQGDRIEVRQYMNLSASVDHRLSDGANAARFLVTMKRLLENPGLLAL
jgi:pyruvate dehydrogenase E2 component (dihydrolipoamide acetyltransferase)